jgi:isoprenylcysteine carboxyl methyltransferase (ICMT) family protein YpbQ
MYSILAAYVILIAYFAITESRRKGQAATTLRGGPFDQASTRLLSLAVAINIILLIVALGLNYFKLGLTVDVIGWIGIAVMLCGITLRMWAVQTLGRFYTRTLRISESQRVVQEGPYKNVRHPGYLGGYPVVGRGRIGDRQLDCCGTRHTDRHRGVSLSH